MCRECQVMCCTISPSIIENVTNLHLLIRVSDLIEIGNEKLYAFTLQSRKSPANRPTQTPGLSPRTAAKEYLGGS